MRMQDGSINCVEPNVIRTLYHYHHLGTILAECHFGCTKAFALVCLPAIQDHHGRARFLDRGMVMLRIDVLHNAAFHGGM